MPIKWSAVKVSEAMDEVLLQLGLAESFLAEAEKKAREATQIPDLPDYMHSRLGSLILTIGRRSSMKAAIKSVCQDIPDGAIEAERDRGKYGNQQGLI